MKKSLSIAIPGILAVSAFVWLTVCASTGGILAFAACAWLTGCASTGGVNVPATATVAKIAAKDATYYALKQHPEWRTEFEFAYDEVSTLAAQDKIDVAALAAIIERLPVKQLKGVTAQIIISDVQIVVQQLAPNNGQIVSSDNFADPKLVIAAIRDGMRMGLDMP